MKKLSIRLLGRLEVSDANDDVLTVSGSKQQGLLAFLALNGDQPPSRDRLIALFWGDRFDEQARQSLRQALSKLRKLVGGDDDILTAEGDRVALKAEAMEVDALSFERLAADGSPAALLEATKLYRDVPLEGLFVKESGFEEWLGAERSRLNGLACQVFERCADHLFAAGDPQAADVARRLIRIDPLRESAHRLLMRILVRDGQRAAALKQYDNLKGVLAAELGVEPEAETIRVLDEIRSPGTAHPVAEAPDARPVMPSPPLMTKPGIAVLPFADLSPDSSGASLADGITEDILAALTRYRWLSVIARIADASAVSELPALHRLAADEGAAYAVEGSVRQSGERLRVTARLVDLQSGRYIWVQRYDRDVKDIFAIQDEISETIAGTIEPELAAAESQRARGKGEDDLGAWDLYHLGLAAQYEFSRESNAEAQRLFRRAIELDPEFAAAYARLAYALVISTIYFEARPVDGILDEALDLSRQATRLDDQDAVARFALGRTFLARGEYQSSVVELEAAIGLNPSLAQAHCALGDSLAYAGRLGESIPRFQEAARLSPHDPYRWAFLTYGAVAYLFLGDHEKAAEWAAEAVRVPNSHYSANAALAAALGHLGRSEEAQAAVAELLRRKPEFCCRLARDRLFYLRDQSQIEHYVEGLKRAGLPD